MQGGGRGHAGCSGSALRSGGGICGQAASQQVQIQCAVGLNHRNFDLDVEWRMCADDALYGTACRLVLLSMRCGWALRVHTRPTRVRRSSA